MNNESDLSQEFGKFSYGFFSAFLSEKGEQVKNFFSENKVGFLPPGCTYSDIRKAQTSQSFKQLRYLIGNHDTLPIVSIGLWMNSLPELEQKTIAEQTRNSVYKENKKKGVSILNMASTGFMEGFIKFLTNYNLKKNLSKEELIDIYEEALEDWEHITYFVQKSELIDIVVQAIQLKIARQMSFIYVFASYGAIPVTNMAITKIESQGLLKQFKYESHREKLGSIDSKIVWIFEKI
ncbi:hypothetical protein HZA98_00615 [Candidatus Woesearchaeota archaeon]|nr:hypothetical protein [Candidatus Woesearchaeota archaeon]